MWQKWGRTCCILWGEIIHIRRTCNGAKPSDTRWYSATSLGKTCIQEKPLFKGANASITLHLLPSLNEHLYSREIFGILVVLPRVHLMVVLPTYVVG